MNNQYQNPVARCGDYADPFVLRYNGKYYLYCTNPDLRCFSSWDLTDWKLEGASIEADTFPGLVPFAPEVVYSNGTFYMYTSPSGFGHFILKSDSPTGPFTKISGNVAHAIDGSVFIDDDGTWYFYWAGEEGIWGCKMHSPTVFGEPVLTGVFMHGWTEGPFVYKLDGIYYMTFTGNHYLSRGYRIHAAWSCNPLTGYKEDAYNPIAVHTQKEGVGLGHSSTVLGPDLVSYYVAYHNLNEDTSRDLNIDRFLWHSEVSQLLGPTRTRQPATGLPDASFPSVCGNEALEWKFDQGKWEEKQNIYYSDGKEFTARTVQVFGPLFTAEFNLQLQCGEEVPCGILLEGEKESISYSLIFGEKQQSVGVWKHAGDKHMLLCESRLPEGYDLKKLHSIRVQAETREIKIWIDNGFSMKYPNEIQKMHLGYFSRGGIIGCGYTAATNRTVDSELKQSVIPAECSFAPVFGDGDAVKSENGGIIVNAGQQMTYRILADSDGAYKLFITAKPLMQDSLLVLAIDDDIVKDCLCKEGLFEIPLKLSAGIHCLTITGQSGKIAVNRLELNKQSDECEYLNTAAELLAGPYGKKLFGGQNCCNYVITAEINIVFNEKPGCAGLLLRVTEPSEGGEGADPILGVDFFLGYSVSFTGKLLQIARHRYDRKILASCPLELKSGKSYTLSASVEGTCIKAYIDGEKVARLEVEDEQPLTHGCAGVWSENCMIKATNFVI